MIIKIENKYPKTAFLTINGVRTPKELWFDEKTGVKDITRKGVQDHINRLKRFGITPDMTDDEAIEQAKKYIENKKEIAV
jgi:hypothetical protein